MVVAVAGEALESVLARAADVIMNECAHARGVAAAKAPAISACSAAMRSTAPAGAAW